MANLAPARIAKPIMIGAAKAARPMSELGKPNNLAVGVSITDLQEMKTFRSQPSAASGLAATWKRSKVRAKAPIQPIRPNTIMVQASDLGALIPVFTLFCSLTSQVWHYWLLTFRRIRAILKVVHLDHTEINKGLAGTLDTFT